MDSSAQLVAEVAPSFSS